MTTPLGTREKPSPAPREGRHVLVAGAEGPDVSEALTNALSGRGGEAGRTRRNPP
ncbi:hypothetical protein [Streptomyces flaveus]|uniref:hypothetical protein n=1 Tax=Streptomyces flaveus TaxID=66370 RepID=UPI00331CE759